MKNLLIKKNIGLTLLLIFFLFPFSAQASNAGFIPGNIWYSSDSFEEGDKVKIYTVIFNPDSRELSGTVVFFDNNVFFAKKDFTAPPKGIKDVYIDWTVNAGDHNIFAKIENAKFLISPGKYEEVYLAVNETNKSSRKVDKKILAETNNSGGTGIIINSIIDSASNLGQNSIKNISDTIEDNTPGFISKSVAVTTGVLETFRESVGTASKNKEAELRKELAELEKKEKIEPKQENQKIQIEDFTTPLKFTELFALALFSNIFDNKFIFYTLLFLFSFLLLYYIVRRVK